MKNTHWDIAEYPLWHGMAQMQQIAEWGGPSKLLVTGDGCWVVDAAGRRYLDARAGICNVNLGYGRRDIADAIHQQALRLPFACSIRFERQASVTLEYARELVAAAPPGMTRVRLTHMGSASVENALLIARRFFANGNEPPTSQDHRSAGQLPWHHLLDDERVWRAGDSRGLRAHGS
jgi:adenosylmethionine-8-amino-7-oxononanoate aminotransferase